MERYNGHIEDNSIGADNGDVGSKFPAWCSFILGGVITFLLVYIGVSRPASYEMALMRRQMSTLEQSIWEVAGHKDSAQDANGLLTLLAEQHSATAAARESLTEMRKLQKEITSEAVKVREALDALAQLTSLKNSVIAAADQATEAADVLAVTEDLQLRLANAADTAYKARLAGDELLLLEEHLAAEQPDFAKSHETLGGLIQIRQQLDGEVQNISDAQNRVEQLVSMKDSILAQTENLADAIETLELTADLGTHFQNATASFERIRHWMVEVVAMEPMLDRARRTLSPLSELSNLRRLTPERLREVARAVSDLNRTQVARKPDSDVSFSDVDLQLDTEVVGDLK